MKRMFVVPDARGLGCGHVLLAAAEERAREHGMHTMRLDTRLDLLAARRLYTKHGYREVPPFGADNPTRNAGTPRTSADLDQFGDGREARWR